MVRAALRLSDSNHTRVERKIISFFQEVLLIPERRTLSLPK